MATTKIIETLKTSSTIRPENVTIISQDYFRLYDEMGLWNTTTNLTSTSMSLSPSFSSSSSALKSTYDPSLLYETITNTTDDNTSSSSSSSQISTQIMTTTSSTTDVLMSGTGDVFDNNVNDKFDGGFSDDFALITSAETIGGELDYPSGGIGSHMHGINDDSISYDISLNRTNSFNQNYDTNDSGGMEMNVDGGGSRSTESSIGGSNFMLLLEDFGDFFYNYNGSGVGGGVGGSGDIGFSSSTSSSLNATDFDFPTNCTATNLTECYDYPEIYHNYWALILILFPFLTLFGNVLVILSVCRERSLQTVTNYFIVSLAIADLLVAVVVMPFAVYVLVNGVWALPNVVCDFYIAMDVICSTSSIFNLVAISIDRYIAVTQPIKYAKHKNSRRVCLTILLVWAISAAIGSPIVLGLNNTPNRDPDLCVFYNTDFIVYSSLSSFYIPCIIMVFLYWNIFKALRSRARKQKAARRPHLSEITCGSVIENIAQTRRLAETALDNTKSECRVVPDEPATNTASGSNEEEDENAVSPEDIDGCHVIVNDKSTEFMLATVVEEAGNVVAQISTQTQLSVADPNGNNDSGYAPSQVDDVVVLAGTTSTPPDSPMASGSLTRTTMSNKRNGFDSSPKKEPQLSVAMKPLSFVRYGVQEALTLARNDSTLSATSKTSRKDKKNSQASRFTIYKVHKASKKKREKSSAKKERKATKTLAIVLGVFLFCWVPFFTCNIMDAICSKLERDCRPGVTAFILTTWLGYINSFVNPVIYTIFNPEFRKAFKKIMHMG